MSEPFTLTSENVHEVIQNLKQTLNSLPNYPKFEINENIARAMGLSEKAIDELRSAGYFIA